MGSAKKKPMTKTEREERRKKHKEKRLKKWSQSLRIHCQRATIEVSSHTSGI
jgi:hypothetical protein